MQTDCVFLSLYLKQISPRGVSNMSKTLSQIPHSYSAQSPAAQRQKHFPGSSRTDENSEEAIKSDQFVFAFKRNFESGLR